MVGTSHRYRTGLCLTWTKHSNTLHIHETDDVGQQTNCSDARVVMFQVTSSVLFRPLLMHKPEFVICEVFWPCAGIENPGRFWSEPTQNGILSGLVFDITISPKCILPNS